VKPSGYGRGKLRIAKGRAQGRPDHHPACHNVTVR
jgi:hypothetical protein